MKKPTPPAWRLAVIDLGTNSVRFDVHEIQGSQVHLKHREKLMLRLGENVFLQGKLGAEPMTRASKAFDHFRQMCEQLKVDKTVAFATSAVREARDQAEFLQKIHTETGIELRVISGKEEARLIARGVIAHEPEAKGRFGLIDIGGGSTEVSVAENDQILASESFPLGAARGQQLFLKGNPPPEGKAAVEALRAHARNGFEKVIREGRWPQVEKMIGSSGTIRALAKISHHSHGTAGIQLPFLTAFIAKITLLSLDELERIPAMEPKRTDLILAGSILLEQCMIQLGAKQTLATEFSLREGILKNEISQH